jgi:hypothetical protein
MVRPDLSHPSCCSLTRCAGATLSTLYPFVFFPSLTLSLADTSALTLLGLKSANSVKYWALLTKLFDASDLFSNAGFHYLRVTLGASDLSPFRAYIPAE